jgi:hypothetical protein
MDAGFASFRHPAAERELKWNMKFAPATIGTVCGISATPEAGPSLSTS